MEPITNSNAEDDPNYLHFPIDAVRERLEEANVSQDVGATAAVYCSAILQFLTSKVITEAVKMIETTDNQSPNKMNTKKINKKRQRSENEEEEEEKEEPPHKKRRICPKDITRALQTDPSLKEWADLIQIPYSQNTNNNMDEIQNKTIQQKTDKIELLNNNNHNCLDGVVIAFEGNFEISDTLYCEQLKKSLEIEYMEQKKDDNMYEQVIYNKTNTNTSIIGCVLKENLSSLLINQFISNPSSYCFTFLYHLSTILSQQLYFATNCERDNRFMIMNRSPISCLSMAMLFMNKKYLTNTEFRLYLNSHQNELFPPCYRPDITIFIEQDLKEGKKENFKEWKKRKNELIFDEQDRILMDDFLFELIIKKIASRKYGKYIFVEKKQIESIANDGSINMNLVSKLVMDILLNKKEICKIYWESDLKAFNNVQNPNIVNSNKRIIYSDEKQIIDGLRMIKNNQLQICDIVYIHISLWMKPKKQFKRLIMAHLCRFESICFYALRHHDLDDRAKQIVQWIFAK